MILRLLPVPAASAFGALVNHPTSSTLTGIGSIPCSRAKRFAAARSSGSCSGRRSGIRYGDDHAKTAYSATNAGAPAIHHRSRSGPEKIITINSARQMNPNSPASPSQ
jgi:hypothetical protein